jgi:hypothetical protein
MAYTVRDLIARLEEEDPDAPVRLGFQPNWPLKFGIHGVVQARAEDDGESPFNCPAGRCFRYGVEDAPQDVAEEHDDAECDCACHDNRTGPVYILSTAGHGVGYDESPYGDSRWWDEAYR